MFPTVLFLGFFALLAIPKADTVFVSFFKEKDYKGKVNIQRNNCSTHFIKAGGIIYFDLS